MKKIVPVVLWTALVLSVGFFIAAYIAINVAEVQPHAGLIYGMFAAHWLATVLAGVLAIRWSFSSSHSRFWPSLGLSLFAMLSSWWGLTCVRITSTQTVNGRVHYLFDSRWSFMAAAVLAVLAFAFTLWRGWKTLAAA